MFDIFKPTTNAIAKPSDLENELIRKSGGSLLLGLKLIQSQSEAVSDGKANVGDWFFGTQNLGKEFKAVVGPWRYHAQRLNNGKVDVEDFNLFVTSKYNAVNNEWEHPGWTPVFESISNKDVPDDKTKGIVNRTGFDFLLWLPDYKAFTVLFLYKTAISMTDTNSILKANRGRTIKMSSQLLKSGMYKWQAPKAMLTTETNEIPETKENEEVINKFLSPGVVFDPSVKESARPR